MAVLVHDLTGAAMVNERMHGGLRAEVWTDLGSVEALWRGMEAAPDCLGTPYQRFDWVAAYLRAGAEAGDLRVVVLRDAKGRPRLLLPLLVRREHGVRVARVVGATHANYHLPLFAAREAAAIPAEDLTALLVTVGREAGIDAYGLSHQPRAWDGAVNPLGLLRAEAAPSDAYGLMLGPDPEATVKRVFSADARKKLRAKEKRLVESFGPVAYRRAACPDEAAAFLAAFYLRKSARFASLGIADPYAGEPIRRFLAAAAAARETDGAPAIELYALVARDSGRIFATFGGAVNADRFSGMMTAFDPDPEVARSSPGDLLLQHLVRDQAARGRRAFDLGVGEARYKASICDETIELVDAVIPVTLRGRAYGAALRGRTRLKCRIKRSPRLWDWFQRARRLRAGPR
ncbi:GNAT family N-acetyltransferase [Methylobacterium nigriterrae]|uniref:GNAT family N-acetyltransferase n=1 Tax=Methylobacterium nigriterrae TaxID=3127512 RepID=UPI003013C629